MAQKTAKGWVRKMALNLVLDLVLKMDLVKEYLRVSLTRMEPMMEDYLVQMKA